MAYSKPELGEYEGSAGSCPRVLRVSAVSPGSPLYYTLQADWEGRLGVLVRNLRTIRVVYWVNVSESSGTSLRVLSWMKGC